MPISAVTTISVAGCELPNAIGTVAVSITSTPASMALRYVMGARPAPAWMKTNDDVKDGHLKPEFYDAFANYFVKYVQGMQSEGIPITAITVENEPLNPKNTPSMVVFAPEEAAFIAGHLGPAFEKAGIHTEIQVYDHNPDVTSYPLSILADPVAGKYVSGTAFHLYGGDASTLTTVHDAYPHKNLYLTEQSITQRPGSTNIEIAPAVSRVLIAARAQLGPATSCFGTSPRTPMRVRTPTMVDAQVVLVRSPWTATNPP